MIHSKIRFVSRFFRHSKRKNQIIFPPNQDFRPTQCGKKSRLLPITLLWVTAALLPYLASPVQAELFPGTDTRQTNIITLNTPRTFPAIYNQKAWREWAKGIREQVLLSAGLWPMPAKLPQLPVIFGKTEHGDFSVEKVYFQTRPGFYLSGNLYRPLGKGKGPFPAVLNPHGHWKPGRLEDSSQGSVVARCIGQARLGMVSFAYDMTGYNDSLFADGPEGYKSGHRTFGTNDTDLLWSINLMGMQLWNSICALDFIASLPDVDARRLGCTGASGGGTQTFILGAVDDRLAVLAPTVMVSHSMQGGCLCENMPGLRIQYSSMDIACVPCPKPQIFMAATGDWTKSTMTVEGPAVASIYSLFRAENKFRYQVLNYNHNYNQDTREHVYAFLAEHLLNQRATTKLPEAPYPAATNLDLRVFSTHRPPPTRFGDRIANERFSQATGAGAIANPVAKG